MTLTDIEWAERYVARIKNSPKKAYAARYLHWLSRNSEGEAPEPIGLGVMAAQAVRMNLDECFRQLGPVARIVLRGNLNQQLS